MKTKIIKKEVKSAEIKMVLNNDGKYYRVDSVYPYEECREEGNGFDIKPYNMDTIYYSDGDINHLSLRFYHYDDSVSVIDKIKKIDVWIKIKGREGLHEVIWFNGGCSSMLFTIADMDIEDENSIFNKDIEEIIIHFDDDGYEQVYEKIERRKV